MSNAFPRISPAGAGTTRPSVDDLVRSSRLVERSEELTQIADAIDGLAGGHGRALLIEGAAGIGKTSLAAIARAAARTARIAVCSATAHEIEDVLPFGVVRQLFAPIASSATTAASRQLFRGAAAPARTFLMGSEPTASAAGPETALRVQHSLFWFLMNLARRRPVLLCIDDAHWSDDASLRFLVHMLAHLDELHVGLLLAIRPPEETRTSPPLQRLCTDAAVNVIRPRQLSELGVGQLVAAYLQNPPPTLSRACHEATAGNPFFLVALLEDLKRDSPSASALDPAQIHQTAPRMVSRAVLMRLAALPPGSVELAIAVAVLGDDQRLVDAARLAGLDQQHADEVCDALVRASILRESERPAFVHPIVRASVYADVGPRERGRLHARAAALLSGQADPAARVALHLMLTNPTGDAGRVETLRAAAVDAMQQGAAEIAVRFLRRALAEPPNAQLRSLVLLELGAAEALAGDHACEEHLREAIEAADDPVVRSQAALTLGRVLVFHGRIPEAVMVLHGKADELWPVVPDAGLAVQAELLNTALLDTRTGLSSRPGVDRLRVRLGDRDGSGARQARSFLASLAAMDGEPAELVARTAERALDGGKLIVEAGPEAPVAYLAIVALIFVDRYDAAQTALDAAVTEARRRGSARGFVAAQTFRSHLNYRRGAVVEAEADARDALAAAPELMLKAIAAGFLADALLERGELDEALELVGVDPGPTSAGAFCHLLHSRGRVLAARGQPAEAAAELMDCGRRLEAIGVRNPATVPWRSAAAECWLGCGEREQARQLAFEELELARRHSAPRGIGMALITAGRCSTGAQALRLVGEATVVLERSGAKLEHARALIALGPAMRRANQRAASRSPLRAGLDLAIRCGATVLADDARVELKAVGARPRRELLTGVGALTPSELRVAQMAGSGMTRTAIAQALFVTPKTIDTHLGHAYSKLAIRSRKDLPAALGSNA